MIPCFSGVFNLFVFYCRYHQLRKRKMEEMRKKSNFAFVGNNLLFAV